MLERLHKLMAMAGVGSRRSCEALIAEGRVSVDGKVIIEMGHKVDPETAEVRLDGERLKLEGRAYYLLNKPQGVISTCADEFGRERVIDLIPGVEKRLYPVGRLDAQSTGLVLLTNDGDVALKLTHPRYEVEKTYEVRVKGLIGDADIARMKKGVWLSDGRARIEGCEIVKRRATVTDMIVSLHEGKNREIRRVMARLGHPVITLKRLSMGPLDLGELKEGEHRKLNGVEIEALKAFVANPPSSRTRDEKRIDRFGGPPTHMPSRSSKRERSWGNRSKSQRTWGDRSKPERSPRDESKPRRSWGNKSKPGRPQGNEAKPGRNWGNKSKPGRPRGNESKPGRSWGNKSKPARPQGGRKRS